MKIHNSACGSQELMRRGLVHVIASDAHDTQHRPLVMNDIYVDIKSEYGPDLAHAVFEGNPRAILEGADIDFDPIYEVPSKKKRWSAIFSDYGYRWARLLDAAATSGWHQIWV